jgi:hypothetical protein
MVVLECNWLGRQNVKLGWETPTPEVEPARRNVCFETIVHGIFKDYGFDPALYVSPGLALRHPNERNLSTTETRDTDYKYLYSLEI